MRPVKGYKHSTPALEQNPHGLCLLHRDFRLRQLKQLQELTTGPWLPLGLCEPLFGIWVAIFSASSPYISNEQICWSEDRSENQCDKEQIIEVLTLLRLWNGLRKTSKSQKREVA